MPESARILQFPSRTRKPSLTSEEAVGIALRYLSTADSEGSTQDCLGDADVVLAVLTELRAQAERSPSAVAKQAAIVYENLRKVVGLGFFDERDYFLGESALIAGSTLRLLGNREEAERWLDRSEAAFRHVVNPAPQLAGVAYARLTLYYDSGRYERALELLPSLQTSFEKLGMEREVLKCRFLESMSLKDLSRLDEARERLEALAAEPQLVRESGLHGLVLMNLGELSSRRGEPLEAIRYYQRAQPILFDSKQTFAVAHLKALVGEMLRAAGNLPGAVESFRAAIATYAELEMITFVAYLRVILAETLIALSRNREAEWELRMALPTIEEQKMVPEAFAAVALLRESVERRQADSMALRELREHLQANR